MARFVCSSSNVDYDRLDAARWELELGYPQSGPTFKAAPLSSAYRVTSQRRRAPAPPPQCSIESIPPSSISGRRLSHLHHSSALNVLF